MKPETRARREMAKRQLPYLCRVIVIFRKYKDGQIIALFPKIAATLEGL